MIWHNMHPVVQIFIICILCGLIAGGIGYMRYIIHNARVKNRLRRIKAASKPIDYTQIDLVYNCEGRIKRNGDELRKLTGGERRNGNGL